MKKVITKQTACIFLCMILAFSFTPQSGAEDAPQDVIRAAQDGLPHYLSLISNDMEDFGFDEDDNLDDVVLGHPYRENYIDVDNYTEGDTIYDVLTEGLTWYFPVMIGDETKCLLGVSMKEGPWEAMMFGRATVAQRIGLVRNVWPLSEGYDPLFFTRYPTNLYFSVPQVDEYNLTRLFYEDRVESEEELISLYANLRPLSETMAYIASQMSDPGDGDDEGGAGGGEVNVSSHGVDASWTGCFIATVH
ncbi:MAG TPA: hypothetical protein PLA74_05180 [Syntrophales bacterium]|nr:hypothetical protein [Syntrophales bacterium]HPQ43957.1 hypothetical protein [Syntrophales bacterium]